MVKDQYFFRNEYFNTFASIVYDAYHSVFSSVREEDVCDGSDVYDEEADQLVFCVNNFSVGGMALSSNVLIDTADLLITVFLPCKMSTEEKEQLEHQCNRGELGPIWNFKLDPNSELEDFVMLSHWFNYTDTAVVAETIKSALGALAETAERIMGLTGK